MVLALPNLNQKLEGRAFDLGNRVKLRPLNRIADAIANSRIVDWVGKGLVDKKTYCLAFWMGSGITDPENAINVYKYERGLFAMGMSHPTYYTYPLFFVYCKGEIHSYYPRGRHYNVEWNFKSPLVEYHVLFAKRLHKRILNIQRSQNTTRLQTVLNLFWIANTSGQWDVNLVMLFAALEALFSTSSTEIAHQLAERCAFFLEPSAKGRINRYSELKRYYNMRSRIVHGERIKWRNGATEKGDAHIFLSESVRLSLQKILVSPKLIDLFGRKKELSDYFRYLVLGK